MESKLDLKFLLVIFLLALTVRFLYFPSNIYFGFDQARDAFAALDILHRHLKLIGPPTSIEGLYHGVLYYYILAPLYFLSNGSPEFVSAILRILNASGVFLIFYLGNVLFNKRVGLFAALLFAISFEQTQFSIYMGNPTLASLTVMLMYLGLALVIFKKRSIGLPIAILGLGFSIQFQFALSYLILPFFVSLIIFRKEFLKIPAKIWGLSFLVGFISLSSFILAEIKYNFRTIHGLLSLGHGAERNFANSLTTYFFTINQMLKFNLIGELALKWLALIVLFIGVIFLFKKNLFRKQVIFLGIWFFSLVITFLVSGGVVDLRKDTPLYYPNIGVSVSLLILVAILLERIWKKNTSVTVSLIGFLIFTNLSMILNFNPKGTIQEIDVQQGMLLSDEKKLLDFLYADSNGPFAVKAVTMPFDINTTWSYLFEWYGQSRYGYLPIWNGKNALGFPGYLKVQEAQEGLPLKRYVIIEPLRGVPQYLVDDFLKEESYFTKVVDERKFGKFTVQKRIKI